jgi:hypothetical protein
MPSPNPENVKAQSRAYENGREDGRRRAYEEIQRAIYFASCNLKDQSVRRAVDWISRIVERAKAKVGS